jgi:transketolase
VGNSEEMRDAFFNEIVGVGIPDDRVVILSADHGAEALSKFEQAAPTRYFNTGIAEQNMISVAAGLAAFGKRPLVYGISPFVSLRVLEQITLDLAAMNLPVTIVSVGAGFTYSTDGATHHGLQDVGAMMTVPNLTILNSSDPENTRVFASQTLSSDSTRYVRIEKGLLGNLTRKNPSWAMDGFSVLSNGQSTTAILSTGSITHSMLEAYQSLAGRLTTDSLLIDVHMLKPFPFEKLSPLLSDVEKIIFVDEGYASGAANQVLRLAQMLPKRPEVVEILVEEKFYFMGSSRQEMRGLVGLQPNQIAETMRRHLIGLR